MGRRHIDRRRSTTDGDLRTALYLVPNERNGAIRRRRRLLLARPGESVYRCFVDTRKDRKGKPVYYCSGCGFKSDRLHRLIGHQRSKRGHRPFACPDQSWYVLPPSLTTPHPTSHPAPPLSVRRATANCPFRVCCSDFRGYSAESLGDHRSDRNGLQTCEWWYVRSVNIIPCFSWTGWSSDKCSYYH